MIQQLDASLLLWFNGWHTAFLDSFVWLFTGRFIWIPMYAALLVMLGKAWGWRKALILALATGLCVALADQLCASVLRPLFCRPRPGRPDSPIADMVTLVNGYRGGHYGFPSCHGANSFALAVAMSMAVKVWRFRAFIFIWATLNCLTRLYLGVHYPGDILAGAAIGSVIAWGVMTVVKSRVRLPQQGLERFPSAVDIPAVTFLATTAAIAISSLT